MTWYASEVIQPAIDKTKAFFKEPGLFGKWVKIGLLIFVFSMLSGNGGMNLQNQFNMPGGETDPAVQQAVTQAFNDVSTTISQEFNTILAIAAVILVILFVIGFIFTLLKNMCFFSILESASTNKVEIMSYLRKFYGKALSLTIFEIILGLIAIPFLLMLLFVGAVFFLSIFGAGFEILGPLAGLATNIPLLIAFVLLSVVALIVLGLAGFVLGQFAAYWMYLTEISAFEAFKKSINLVMANLSQVIFLILVQIVLGIVAAIIGFIVFIIIAIPFAIVGFVLALILIPIAIVSPAVLLLGIALLMVGIFLLIFVVSITLAPVSLFFFNYDLMFLKKLLPGKGIKGRGKAKAGY